MRGGCPSKSPIRLDLQAYETNLTFSPDPILLPFIRSKNEKMKKGKILLLPRQILSIQLRESGPTHKMLIAALE